MNMKKESINEIITPIMELILNSKINGKDKTELMIMLGKFLENYDLNRYSEVLYEKRLVKTYESI